MRYSRLRFVAAFLLLPCLVGAQGKTPQPQGTKPAPKTVTPQTPAMDSSGKTQLEAGKTRTIAYLDGASEVTAFRLKIEPADRYTLRQTLLRIFWEDADKPAVEVPVGDFFDTPFAPVLFKSLYLRGEEAGYISNFPMRFRRKMRVELSNRGKTALDSVQWKLIYKRLASVPPQISYLHAQWMRTETKPNIPTVLWKSQGRIEVLGTALALQSAESEFAPLVSDKAHLRFWTANADTPTIATTVLKFFDLGNPVPRDAATYARTGTTLMAQTIGRMSVYGFLDVSAFMSSQDARLEAVFPAEVDVAATTYWTQQTPTHTYEPIDEAQLKPATFHLKNVIEAESLPWEGGDPAISTDRGFKGEASGGALVTFSQETAIASFPVAAEDVYTFNIAALIRPGNTLKYRYALDGEPFSELTQAQLDPLDAESTSLWITSIPIHLKSGTHKIAVQSLENKPLSLDYLDLMPSQKVEGATEVENLIGEAKFSPMTTLVRDDDSLEFSGGSFLRWGKIAENAELSLPIEFSQAGDYTLDLGILREPDSPKLTVKLDDKILGEVDAFIANRDINVQPLLVGKISKVTAGKHTLTLVAQAQKLGKPGTLNLDYYRIKRVSP